MSPWVWGLLAGLALAAPAEADDVRIRTLTGDWPTAGVRRVECRLPPGAIRIEPSPDQRLRVELDVYCSFDHLGCVERTGRLVLETRLDGNRLRLSVRGVPRIWARGLHLRGRVLVPSRKALAVDFPAGELQILGMEGDLEVEAGAGEVEIDLRETHVRSVRLGVGIGEASLSVAGHRVAGSGWLGHKVRWGEGSGPARVSVSLAVGEVQVRLD